MSQTTITDELDAGEARSSRRNLLRLAGSAAVAGAGASLLSTGSASAATGAMQYGASNVAGGSETTLSSSAPYTLVLNNSHNSGYCLRAAAVSSGTGLVARVDSPAFNGYGVEAIANGALGYGAVISGGQAQMRIVPENLKGPSSLVNHRAGEVAYDGTTNALWVCITDGNPGTWRKLAGVGTAGAFHPISPSRVWDSRKVNATISTGQTATVSVADKIDIDGFVDVANIVPGGATAVAFTLTIAKTVGSKGYLTVNEGGNTAVSASTINWSGSNQTHANSSIVKVDAQRRVTVICGGAGASTDYIIDVTGYYL